MKRKMIDLVRSFVFAASSLGFVITFINIIVYQIYLSVGCLFFLIGLLYCTGDFSINFIREKTHKFTQTEPLILFIAAMMVVFSFVYFFNVTHSSKDVISNSAPTSSTSTSKDISLEQKSLAANGDYFGGILGAGFGFLTVFLLVVQGAETKKRESERFRLEFLAFENSLFYQDLEFLSSKLNSIVYDEATGVEALNKYNIARLRSTAHANNEFLVACESCYIAADMIFRNVFEKLTSANPGSEEYMLRAKHFEIVTNTFHEIYFRELNSAIGSFAERRREDQSGLMFSLSNYFRSGPSKYPRPWETDKLKFILNESKTALKASKLLIF